ncbi:MAG TPA: universal stress protein [Vicinamibacterales bacterium]|jgi:nucleotide-binding universal stress UspA family protein
MVTLKKVLVATDFGEASAAALRYGRAFASTFGAALQVLHVTENLALMPLASLEGNVGLGPGVQEDIERAARRQTEALLTHTDRRWLRAEAVTITSDRAADAIVEFARANKVDLIVIGTHGRRALARLVMGSVAERVIRTAPCPVLTVHSLQHEFVAVELPVTAVAEVGL